MALGSFADKSGCLSSEIERIEKQRVERFPRADDDLTGYTTLAFHVKKNPTGFCERDLREMCSQRNLPPPVGATSWAGANSRLCTLALFKWREELLKSRRAILEQTQ
jgi:hypothetical protein